jgi:RHH-type rel operon transcriptional repressor/antitoxin RelB
MDDNIVSLQLTDTTKERLERLSETTHRSAEALAAEALEAYLTEQEWQIAVIDEAVRLAEDGEFVSHDAMSAWLKSWGTDAETAPPEPDVFKDRQ